MRIVSFSNGLSKIVLICNYYAEFRIMQSAVSTFLFVSVFVCHVY
jgi:hypothetical protein